MARITQIQVRRDTEANWATAQTNAGVTPILTAGEVGYISSGTNAGKFKIGDGTSLWGALLYATDGANIVAGTIADTALTSGVSTLGTAGNLVKYGTNGLVTAGSGGVTSTGTGTFATVVATIVSGTTATFTGTGTFATVVATTVTATSATYSGLAYSTADSVILKTASFTVGAAETNFNVTGAASVTVTLPAAASFPGREINIVNKAAFTIVSSLAASVMPRTGTQTAGTQICAAVVGSHARLVSNGTIWYIMAGA